MRWIISSYEVVEIKFMSIFTQTRHPELVSGSVEVGRLYWFHKWILNQVQHDDGGSEG